ncbi:hypothetical protein I553_7414 [Mycobacterium xenopi 4042]|uniref:Uncharacterized protein n=1 Tax=Mycobacterium xenopi 4042 TaxID=1299334 RepID=X8E980_MYCXE|nr:hypothetical protein I553_7414 [Mycobacterium xenopi 4042]
MDLQPYVDAVRAELDVAAAASGPDAQALAERLTAALESAIRLALLQALSEAAEEITGELARARWKSGCVAATRSSSCPPRSASPPTHGWPRATTGAAPGGSPCGCPKACAGDRGRRSPRGVVAERLAGACRGRRRAIRHRSSRRRLGALTPT